VAPIAAALKNIQFWLTRENSFHLIIAAPTVRELKRQGLPAHVQIKANKRLGKRVTSRKRHYHESHTAIAYWPEDALLEGALFVLAYVIRGEADFRIADYVLHCRTGDIILFPPGIPRNDGSRGHLEGDPTNRVCEILWMDTFSTIPSGVRCWICRSDGNQHRSGRELGSCLVPYRLLTKLFEGFCEELKKGRKRNIVIGLLDDFISLLRDEIESGDVLEGWGRMQYANQNEEDGPIAKALIYIEENLDQHLTIGNVAQHVLVSPATFTRHFKERTGETFQQYQTNLRMKFAEEMLRNSELSILTICGRVGLGHGRFWTLFQQKHGCSPTEFRQQKIDRKRKVSSGK